MAIPTTRTEFLDYCLRRLGAPVIEIDVDPSQVDDCIDDAIKLYMEYHYDGSIKTLLKYQLTSTDFTNGYIPIPDYIIGVTRVIPFSMSYGAAGTLSEAHYQLLLSDIFSYMDGDIISYDMSMRHLTLLNYLLNPVPVIQYNQYMQRLKFSNGIDSRLKVGDHIIIECYRAVNPSEFSKVWNNSWLKNYTTALIKRVWASNFKKFDGMVLPGGVSIDGKGMYVEATQEIEELETELKEKYQPAGFYMG